MESEPSWKQLGLSLERPYKDDHGNTIPVVEDITPNGEYIYETKENPSARLGANLRRIFLERGLDFFDKTSGGASISGNLQTGPSDIDGNKEEEIAAEEEEESKAMTYDDLREMREEIVKHLAVSLGEVTHAQQVLAALLATPSTESHPQSQTQPQLSSQSHSQLTSQPQVTSQPPNVKFAATVATKPSPITSVQAFNAQLTIGGKDEALRHAASLFKVSAESMERTRLAGERYWVDALRIRRNNWGLVPAPLPPGSATGKGADKTSKDFLVSFGLEESPTQFRRRAVGRLSTYAGASHDMIFPYRRKNRLRVSIVTRDQLGAIKITTNDIPSDDETSLDGALRTVQCEIVEQEIFSILVQEAGSLPTASAKVSEQLIVIDAAQGLELQIELTDVTDRLTEQAQRPRYNQLCDLIYHGLYILLLRRHAFLKGDRLSSSILVTAAPQRSIPAEGKPAFKYPVLQPIIDLLQYRVFLERIQGEITQMALALRAAGIPTNLVMNTVGETGKELIKFLDSKSNLEVGGEIILRIFDRHTVRFTFVSPSTLVTHLSQSTLTISSIPQLCQLLMDEVEQCLLNRVRDLGKGLTENMEGTWFIDLDHCIGRWEGCVLNFRVTYGPDYKINCTAYFLGQGKQGQAHQYPPKDYNEARFLDWAHFLIGNAIKQSNTCI